jgi:hypothetical protein
MDEAEGYSSHVLKWRKRAEAAEAEVETLWNVIDKLLEKLYAKSSV